MSQPTPYGDGPVDRPPGSAEAVRASDAEREAVVEWLRIASVEGRLTFAELTERTETAYGSVTRDELDRTTADLPELGAPGANPAPRQAQLRFAAVMSESKERIVGRIDRPLEVLSIMGDVVLDLRDAQVPSGEVSIVATAVMGSLRIIIPDGVDVRMTGYSIMSERKVKVRKAPAGQTVPIVRIRTQAVMAEVTIVDDEHQAPARRAIASWWRNRGDHGKGH